MADLTRNQALVLSALESSDGPMSAYAILDALRDHGLRAPLQIYRALEQLTEAGRVHRLESLNAYVACSQAACGGHHAAVAFLICETCDHVRELTDDAISADLSRLAQQSRFRPARTTVEVRGTCHDCLARAG